MQLPNLTAFATTGVELAKAGFFEAIRMIDPSHPQQAVACVINAACIYRKQGHGEADGLSSWCLEKYDAECSDELNIVNEVAAAIVQSDPMPNLQDTVKMINGVRQPLHQEAIEHDAKGEKAAILGTMDVNKMAVAALGLARVTSDVIGLIADEAEATYPEPDFDAPEPEPEIKPEEPAKPEEPPKTETPAEPEAPPA